AGNCWCRGDYTSARSYNERIIAAYNYGRDRPLASRFGYDSGVVAMLNLAVTHLPLGNFTQATFYLEEAFALVERIEHIPTLAVAHGYATLFWVIARNARKVREHAEVMMALGQKHDMLAMLAFGKLYAGWARWNAGERGAKAWVQDGLSLAQEM